MHYDYKKLMNDQKINEAARRLEWDIVSIIRERTVASKYELEVVVVSYLLEKTVGTSITYEEICNNDIGIDQVIVNQFTEMVKPDEWKRIVERAENYDKPVFVCLALTTETQEKGYDESTPASIVRLSERILGCSKKDAVADICCGGGTFIVNHIIQGSGSEITGFEINVQKFIISKIRIELIGGKSEVVIGNVFETIPASGKKFDKIFSNYPFGLRLKMLDTGAPYLDELFTGNPAFTKATSSDWIFNSLICDSLAKKGRAVAIITNGSTWNNIDMGTRRHFVENGLIESVIALPKNMFSFTNVATSLVVFSFGNKSIRLVDASNNCVQGRRINVFSDENIEAILEALKTDSDISKTITLEELRNNDYSLHYGRYVSAPTNIENGVKFENIIKRITRGAPCTAKDLDEMASEIPTNSQYLMLSNIKDGMIDEDLPYISGIDEKHKKYCLKNNNLILSKNGYPYKVAVVNMEGDKQVLANGNLYIIELDEKKANPYYIKAFLDSEDGIATLKSITVGATIPNIGVEDLKSILIPLPSMEEQERIAKKYQATRDEVFILKKRLDQAINRLQHCLDDDKEG
ncbi:MAG: N-6 DNA methylase [Saccharofermentans sp.]|nr:N-6 DNA methylase [Saccharofermentans sp.]